MSVWFVIPSKRIEYESTIPMWRERGYMVAVAREPVDGELKSAHITVPVPSYQGWARSTNLLVALVIARFPEADWFVGGGDDIAPDPNHTADEIAAECREYFAGRGPAERVDQDTVAMSVQQFESSRTFGVMQPTGDRWMDRGDGRGAVIDRIAGSPWMGREFCQRMYHGAGPLYNGYYHNFADEELQNVAQKLGVFWQRRDLMQEHRHWARPRGDWNDAPDWARKINDSAVSDWDKSKALFAARKAAGFPGHEPLDVS